jgi:serine protease Do
MRRTLWALLLVVAACSRRPEPPPAEAPPPVSVVDATPLPPGGYVTVPEIHLPSLAPLVERVTRTVVSLEVEATPEIPPGHERYLRAFPGGIQPEQRAGSGFLVNRNGEVVTNNHVVQGARHIVVELTDGRRFDADLVGRDGPTDLALVRLKDPPGDLPVAALGDSDHLKVGDWLIAVGNPFGLASSVSLGILSATARDLGAGPYDEFLQTDAAINPGNSGGPLFDMEGRVVGVNTAIAGQGTSIGFAVPSSEVRALLPELERVGGITRGALGVYLQELTPPLADALGIPGKTGAVVTGFAPGSSAPEAGLAQDDVIVALDDHPVESSHQLIRLVGMRKPGETVKLGIIRAGQTRSVPVKLSVRSDLEGTGPLSPTELPAAAATPARLGMLLTDDREITPDMQRELGERFGLTPDRQRELGEKLSGPLVVDVRPDSPAARAGVKPGQQIVAVAGHPVHSVEEAAEAMQIAKPPLRLVLRGEKGKTRAVTLRP